MFKKKPFSSSLNRGFYFACLLLCLGFGGSGHLCLLTFGVIERVHVSADVPLQVVMEARRGGEEVQADGHQLPASFQAVVTEILCSLTT